MSVNRIRVLLLGGQGQLGQALSAACPSSVVLVSLTRAGLDIADTAMIPRMVEHCSPDLIINSAAYTAVDKAESEPELAHVINAKAVETLAATGIPLVHVSTDFVFDGMQSTPYQTDAEPNPQSVYGASKRAGELVAGQDALIIRTAWVYSEHGQNFVKTMLRVLVEKPVLSVVADQVGTPTYAPSLAKTIWALAQNGSKGIYHATDAGVASWYDFAVAIQEEAIALGLLEKDIPITPIATKDYPTPAKRPTYSVLDKSKTWDLLGEPSPHWRENLRQMLKQVKDHG